MNTGDKVETAGKRQAGQEHLHRSLMAGDPGPTRMNLFDQEETKVLDHLLGCLEKGNVGMVTLLVSLQTLFGFCCEHRRTMHLFAKNGVGLFFDGGKETACLSIRGHITVGMHFAFSRPVAFSVHSFC